MTKVCWRYEEYYGDYIDLSDWAEADYDHVGNIMEYFDVSIIITMLESSPSSSSSSSSQCGNIMDYFYVSIPPPFKSSLARCLWNWYLYLYRVYLRTLDERFLWYFNLQLYLYLYFSFICISIFLYGVYLWTIAKRRKRSWLCKGSWFGAKELENVS